MADHLPSPASATAGSQVRTLAAHIAHDVQAAFAALPKNGKPQPNEHTVLAGIAAYITPTDTDAHSISQPQPVPDPASMAQHSIRVLAIGTGTKCLGASKRSPAGDVLNDSHAEVIARRAFVAWVYQQLQLAAAQELQPHQADPAVTSAGHAANPPKAAAASEVCQNQSGTPAAAAAAGKQQSHPTSKQKQQSAFVWCPETRRFALRPGIRFALYVSQPPCGDASIFSRLDTEACCGADQGASAVGGGSSNDTASPQQQQQQAVGRTGAKLLRPLGAADIADAAASAAAAATAADAAASSADEAAGQIGLHSDKPNEQTQQQTKQQQQQAEQQQQYVVPTARHVEAGPQQLGVLRRKPGKGDPTLSLSCSDKIARWACLGLQGCLLSSILQEPLYLGMIVVYVPVLTDAAGGGGQQQDGQQQGVQQVGCGAGSMLAAAEAAGRRAFGERLAGCAEELRGPYRVVQPQVVAVGAADMQLGLQPGGSRTVPSGTSINWNCELPLYEALLKQAAGKKLCALGAHEVTLSAFGRIAGAARKGPAATSIKSRSRLSQAALFEVWQQLVHGMPGLHAAASDQTKHQQDVGEADGAQLCKKAKAVAGSEYQGVWRRLKDKSLLFAGWLAK